MGDPIISKILRETVGLRAGGAPSEHEVLATYSDRSGEDLFALCRDGLLVRGSGVWRYIDHAEIAEVDLPIVAVKTVTEERKLVLTLDSGERLDVSVDGTRGQDLDVFPIHAFVMRRVHQRRALGR